MTKVLKATRKVDDRALATAVALLANSTDRNHEWCFTPGGAIPMLRLPVYAVYVHA